MGRVLLTELPLAIVRLAAALVIYGMVTAVPWAPEAARWIGPLAGAALAAACVLTLGMLLVDTLFFDRHWRRASSR